MNVSVIIPTYNGKPLLERFLPHNLTLFAAAGIHEIIVADDGGTDDTEAFLKTHCPTVTYVRSPKNQGFAHTVALGISKAKGDIYFLLNNDIKIIKLDMPAIKTYLTRSNIFAVTPKMMRQTDPPYNESLTYGRMKHGWYHLRSDRPKDFVPKEGDHVLWSCGGASFINAEKYHALDGLDKDLFSPFYVEDVDLSYRAWQQGWKSVYNDSSSVDHLCSPSTSKAMARKKLNRLCGRNQYLFIWKNISDRMFLIHHILRILYKTLTLNINEIKIITAALKKLPQVQHYRRTKPAVVLSDRDILALLPK